MDIIVEELRRYGIDVGENILESVIEECVSKQENLLQQMSTNINFNERTLRIIYYKMGNRREIGAIIAFYSLIVVYYKGKKKKQTDIDLIRRLTMLTVLDFLKSTNRHWFFHYFKCSIYKQRKNSNVLLGLGLSMMVGFAVFIYIKKNE